MHWQEIIKALRVVSLLIVLTGAILWVVTGKWRWMVTGLGVVYIVQVVASRLPSLRPAMKAAEVRLGTELPPARRAEDLVDAGALMLPPLGVLAWIWWGAWQAAVAAVVATAVIMLTVITVQERRQHRAAHAADVRRWLDGAPYFETTEADLAASVASGECQVLSRDEAADVLAGRLAAPPAEAFEFNTAEHQGYRRAVRRPAGAPRPGAGTVCLLDQPYHDLDRIVIVWYDEPDEGPSA